MMRNLNIQNRRVAEMRFIIDFKHKGHREMKEHRDFFDMITLLRVKLVDGTAADRIFSILAGKDVARRRAYIQKHALDVRNLDI